VSFFFRVVISSRRVSNLIYSTQAPTIVFDVALPLEEVQAPRDFSKSTPIALVKVEPSFLPGTTIGATHWVAYGMSKGVHIQRILKSCVC
jgi:hypothetical protein